MKSYGLSLPGSVYSGENAISKIADIIRANGTRHPVLFTTEGIRQTGLLDLVIDVIPGECGEPAVLDDLAVEPTYSEVQSVVDRCNELEADMLIAVGGGSVIDATKLVSLLINSSVTVKDLLDDPLAAHKTVKVICVPTTAGTGAEATPNAIVAVPEKELKVGIVNPMSNLTISRIDGVINDSGREIANFTTGKIRLARKSNKVYPLTCEGAIAKDVGLTDLLKYASTRDFSGMTVDLNVKVRFMLGICKTFRFKDLRITDLMEPSVAAAYLDLIVQETMI